MDSLTPRQFGVEIEVSRRLTCVNHQDRHYSKVWNEIENTLLSLASDGSISNKWRMKVDTSCGGEVVSPPLFGPDGLRQTAIVCSMLRKIAKKHGKPAVDGECGLHIHLDASGLTPPKLSRLFTLVHMSEPIIYAMYPARNFNYCSPIDVNMRQAGRFRDWVDVRDVWYRGSNNVRQRDKVYSEEFINSSRAGDNYDGTRYHGFNIHCFWKLNTVEFRYGSGTIDPLHIKAYYEMCLAMLNTALSDKSIDSPANIKSYKYQALANHYYSNFRFRKFVKKIASLCNFSRGTVRLILNLVRDNNPDLLTKEAKEPSISIDYLNVRDFVFVSTRGTFDWRGKRILASSKEKIAIAVSLKQLASRHYLLSPLAPNVTLNYRIVVHRDKIISEDSVEGSESIASIPTQQWENFSATGN